MLRPSIFIQSPPPDHPSSPSFPPNSSPCPSFDSLNDTFSYPGQSHPYALVNHPSLSRNPYDHPWLGVQSPPAMGDARSSINTPGTLQELCRLFVTQEADFHPLSDPDLILSHIHQNSKDTVVIKSLSSILSEHGLTSIVGTKAVKTASAARRKRNGKFFCKMCMANLTTKGNAQNHVMAHFRLRFQLCAVCGSSFGTSLRRHLKTCKEHPRMYSNRNTFEDSPNPSSYDVSPNPSSYDVSPNPSSYNVSHFSDPSILAGTQEPMALTSPSPTNFAQSSHSPIVPHFYFFRQ